MKRFFQSYSNKLLLIVVLIGLLGIPLAANIELRPNVAESFVIKQAGVEYLVDPTETDQGATGNGRSVKAFVDAIGSNKATLIFRHKEGDAQTTYAFSTSINVPSNIAVRVENGAIISPDAEVIVTFEGSFSAGRYDVSGGDGTVVINNPTADVDGDRLDIDWNPSVYTPDTSPSEVGSEDDLTAHLKGIDNVFAASQESQGYTESPMVVSGGELSEGTNAGTFKVAALTALLRTSDSLTGKLEKVTKASEDNIAITAADTTYYVCLNYNGGSPTISLSTSSPYEADKRNIPIGKVRKDTSNNVHYISGGFRFQDGIRKSHHRAKTLRELELESGSTIAYSGTDNFTMEAGVVYGGLNEFLLSAYNSATTKFTMLYSDGGDGWTETERNTIDHTHYDDGSGTLATIGNNKYGCHYVYRHIDDSHVYVVLGTDSYTLAEAVLNSVIPPERPAYLDDFGCLIGCIIAPKAGGSFTKVVMVTSQFFSGAEVADHSNLSGLDYGSSGHTGFAKSGVNDNITSMTGLDDDGIPYAKVYGAGNLYFPDYNETDQGATGNGKSIKAYVDSIDTDSGTIVLRHNSGGATTTYQLSTNETIPSNITLEIENGAILNIASGKTLIIENFKDPGLIQVFSGDGNVSFGDGTCSKYLVEWFGGAGDGSTDNYIPFTKLVASLSNGGKILLGNGQYNSSQEISLNSNITVEGQGYSTHCYLDSSDNYDYFFSAENKAHISVKSLRITTSKAVSLGGIQFSLCDDIHTEDIYLNNISDCAIELTGCVNWSVINTRLGSDFVAGVVAYNSDEPRSQNGLISGFWSNGGTTYYPIDIEASQTISNITVKDYFIKNSPYPGIAFQGVRYGNIGFGIIDGCTGTHSGIYLHACNDISIESAQSINNSNYGIEIEANSHRITLDGVITYGNTSGGVHISTSGAYSTDIIITPSCILRETPQVVNASCDNTQIINNALDNDLNAQDTFNILPSPFFADIATGGTLLAPWRDMTGATLSQDESTLYSVRSLKITTTNDTWSHITVKLPINIVNQLRGRLLSGILISKGAAENQGSPRICVSDDSSTTYWTWDNKTTSFKPYEFQVSISPTATFVQIIIYVHYGGEGVDGDVVYLDSLFLSIGSPKYYTTTKFFASGPPAVGTWERGNIVWNSEPAAGGTSGWVCVNRQDTAMRVTGGVGDTTLEVDSTTGTLADDVIGVVLNDGTIHWTTVASIVDGDTLTITDGLPSAADVDNIIYTNRWKAMANLAS